MGSFLIFNNSWRVYSNEPSQLFRKGINQDADALEKAMKKMGFNVLIYNNKETQEIKTTIAEYSKSKYHSYSNAFGLAFLSHGDENGNLKTLDGNISIEEIIKPFIKTKDLMGKPKLFFFEGNDMFLFNI